MLQESDFTWLQEDQTLAFAMRSSCRTAHTMDVVPRVIWWVNLQDPIHRRNIETSCCDIRADECAMCRIAEFKEGICSLLLLLLAVEREDGQVDVVEEVGVVVYGGAGGEEDDDLQ